MKFSFLSLPASVNCLLAITFNVPRKTLDPTKYTYMEIVCPLRENGDETYIEQGESSTFCVLSNLSTDNKIVKDENSDVIMTLLKHLWRSPVSAREGIN